MIQDVPSDVLTVPETSDDLFGDFRPWFSSKLVEPRPSLVVAIRRRARRFMQLHPGSLPDGTPFLSHDALPFLSDADLRGLRVLLFDDSVIYGSTMARTKEYLERRGQCVLRRLRGR